MKLKRLLAMSALALVGAFAFAACGETPNPDNQGGGGGENNGGGGNKLNSYTLEAEYVDLTDAHGAGISSDQSGCDMIYGEGTDAHKDKGWSSGYYVGYSYTSEFALEFEFEASADATATIVLRLGSELGNITLTPESFTVALNGTPLTYSSMYVEGSDGMENMKFSDKTVTSTASLKAGKNVIRLSISTNDLRNGQTGGPTIDCVKIQTSATLTYTEHTENPSRRGAII